MLGRFLQTAQRLGGTINDAATSSIASPLHMIAEHQLSRVRLEVHLAG
jgi:hypothetical protein